MLDEGMRPHRSPVRFLAPLMLVVIALAVYLVVDRNLSPGTTTPARAQTTSHPARTRARSKLTGRGRRAATYYTVKQGDTLSAISARTGVPLPTLQSLNPGADTHALQVGQRLKLRP